MPRSAVGTGFLAREQVHIMSDVILTLNYIIAPWG